MSPRKDTSPTPPTASSDSTVNDSPSSETTSPPDSTVNDSPSSETTSPPAQSDAAASSAPLTDPSAPASTSENDLNTKSFVGPVIEVGRDEEFHITVLANSAVDWERFCIEQGATPLFIELNATGVDGQLQLMCEIEDQESFDDFTKALAAHEEFKVIRIKHEVQSLKRGETPLYFEAHVKFDGPYRPDLRGASRDLYRLSPSRWYVTRRGPGTPVPTDIRTVQGDGKPDLVETVTVWHAPFSHNEVLANYINLEIKVDGPNRRSIEGVDSEWVLVDTNPGLDAGWL